MFDNAVRHQLAGDIDEAEKLCGQILLVEPRHAFALHLLGVLAYKAARYDVAIDLIRRAIAQNGQRPAFHNNLGNALRALGRMDEALDAYRQALVHQPDFAEVHRNLGVTLMDLDRQDEAVQSYRRAIACKVNYAEAFRDLGNALAAQGKKHDAIAAYREALTAAPDYAEAHNDLGIIFQAQNRLTEAAASYHRAMTCKPGLTDASVNFALLMNEQGRHTLALSTILSALQSAPTTQAKTAFVECVRHTIWEHYDNKIHDLMTMALTDAWARPGELARSAISLVILDPDVCEFVTSARDEPAQIPMDLFCKLGSNSLLIALLCSSPVCDIRLERALTVARRKLLEMACEQQAMELAEPALTFFSSLARQCFVNEYVFARTPDEEREAAALRNRLAEVLRAGATIPAAWIVAAAAYFPLSNILHVERLLDKYVPKPLADILLQQIEEPARELQERRKIPQLSVAVDEASLPVKSQYEENPYPRWVKMAPLGSPKSVARYLSDKFPLSGFRRPAVGAETTILIAGCGTGQQAIDAAWRFKGARVLAFDLSSSSLAHAARKTHELGVTSITYAQADLLNFEWSGPAFDVIECVGVLHHLPDPWTGWKCLLSKLRPNGFMRVGLYSKLARQDIALARDLIAREGYRATADDIRRFRQRLLETPADFGKVTEYYDFFSLGMCRDMLFHVQEHLAGIADIAAFLRDHDLTFMGFDVSAGTLRSYRQRFADDPAAINLAHWQIFEAENPDIFSGMYQFWVQKSAPD